MADPSHPDQSVTQGTALRGLDSPPSHLPTLSTLLHLTPATLVHLQKITNTHYGTATPVLLLRLMFILLILIPDIRLLRLMVSQERGMEHHGLDIQRLRRQITSFPMSLIPVRRVRPLL